MTPGEVLEELSRRGIQLYLSGGFLRYRGPVGAFDDEMRAAVLACRNELLADWVCPSCEQIHPVFFGFHSNLRCRSCSQEVEP